MAENFVQGTGDNEFIFSTNLDDRINAGYGNDFIFGSAGQDIVSGGDGFDIITFKHLLSPVTLNAFGIISSPGRVVNTKLESIEKIIGSSSAYDCIDASLADSAGANVIINLASEWIEIPLVNQSLTIAGFENIIATNSHDTITGNSLDNTLDLRGGNDKGGGSIGNDSILGGGGDDSLFGGMGEDLLVGGQGADYLKGGLGIDTFRYLSIEDSTPSTGVDMVADFRLNEVIDLSFIDPFPNTAKNESFTWIGPLRGETLLPQAGASGYRQDPGGITIVASSSSANGISQSLEVFIAGINSFSLFNIIL